MNWIDILGFVSAALTVVALLLALYQTWQALDQTQKLEGQSNSLRVISDSLSTRYLGPFPDYLSSVTDLVESSKSELCIINTIPTPGYFSAQAIWLSYRHAIERKLRQGVSIRLICMDENQRRKRTEKQFPSCKGDWDHWKVVNHAKIIEFLRFRYPEAKLETLDHVRFVDLLLATQQDIFKEMFKGAMIREVDQTLAIQIWIADRSRAVFSIQTSTPNVLSHGLFTSDARFVTALQAMMTLYDPLQVEQVAR